ncbi:GntR family transcriptional regulator [Gordonia sp. CPCC 206044]|uniref:GntR family transcriptional regulator n=1 Tax=Gordonia sp. CPCC 206044 TaxID=3140793 RepID=UPI003AF40A1F
MTITNPVGRRDRQSRWLRDILRSDILNGDRPSRSHLPAESSIMVSEGQVRAAVRGALGLLRDEGVIERIPGTGTLAVAQRFSFRITELHGSEPIADRGVTNHVLEKTVIPMPRRVAEKLDCSVGEPCLLLEYIGYHRGRPAGIYTNYIRFPEAAAIDATIFSGDWWTLLADAGLSVGATELRIESLSADEELASVLETEVDNAILGMEQLILDADMRPFDYALLRNRGDRIALSSVAQRADREIPEA